MKPQRIIHTTYKGTALLNGDDVDYVAQVAVNCEDYPFTEFIDWTAWRSGDKTDVMGSFTQDELCEIEGQIRQDLINNTISIIEDAL